MPFLAVERILIWMVTKAGANRQECHERIREHSQAAGNAVKLEGRPNDLVARLQADSYFAPVADKLAEILDPRAFSGRASNQVSFINDFSKICIVHTKLEVVALNIKFVFFQVDEFLRAEVTPALKPYLGDLEATSILLV